MKNKFYSVIIPRNPNGGFSIKNFDTLENARFIAQKEHGEVWEFEDHRRRDEEDHTDRGKLIENYS